MPSEENLGMSTALRNLNSSSSKKSQSKRKICLSGCRYDVVHRVALELGFRIVPEYDLWDIIWSDAPLPPERVMEMRRVQNLALCGGNFHFPFVQKMNHFPGMYEICRKDRLGRNLNRFKRVFPDEFDFFPLTWDLPADLPVLLDYWKKNKNMTFIVKPESGCQGKGIFLVKNLKILSPFAKCVCQQYITQPFLIDGYKYDQRIYVLVTCVDPLRIYIYNEGIARLATVKYSMPNDKNLDVVFMHLTNYSLNKFSESYDPQGDGSKRKLTAVYNWMIEHGHETKKLIKDIDDIIIKTILCATPTLKHNYKTAFPKCERGSSCFELLGFDILVDRHLRPTLIEVNHSPSFNLDLEVDSDVKTQLLRDLFEMLYFGSNRSSENKGQAAHKNTSRPKTTGLSPDLQQALQDQFNHEVANSGNFRLIFAEENAGKYSRFLDKDFVFMDLEEESFLKKRLEPLVSSPSLSDCWAQDRSTKSSLKLTRTGQLYVETKPQTPGVLDPHEFMKFKYNTEQVYNPHPKFSIASAKARERQMTKDKPLKAMGENSRFESFREPRNDANMRETFESPLRRLTTPLDRDQLSPSERVKIALERLRWKNINKQLSQEITEQRARPSSSETDGEKTSQYSFGLFERDRPTLPLAPLRKSQSTVNRKKPRSETASQYLKVPDLDGSKLPSVMQHFCEPSNRSARRKQSSNYVTEWLNKSSIGSKEKRQPPLVRNEVSDSDDFLNEWLKAAGHANSLASQRTKLFSKKGSRTRTHEDSLETGNILGENPSTAVRTSDF